MYKLLTKNGQTFAFGLGVLVTVIFLGSVFSGMSSFQSMSEADRYATTIFNFGLYASIGLTILGVVVMIPSAVLPPASAHKTHTPHTDTLTHTHTHLSIYLLSLSTAPAINR